MTIDFNKGEGLVPAIIQNATTGKVLMLGYMNEEAYQQTLQTGMVTFFSRSKNRLWTKGETSGNTLKVVKMELDCDQDTLLILVDPNGPACHRNTETCFDVEGDADSYHHRSFQNFTPTEQALQFIAKLEQTIKERRKNPIEGSYTNFLFDKGLNKMAQKVGEEAVEVVIDAVAGKTDTMKGEAADLIFHLLVLLEASGLSLAEVVQVLESRHKPRE
ncbi:bifunctional phosphoribosyl-AMP cyclohydrolase/phosphoribosyl-ATP diphosphatase HisIE [Rufibacter sediminis]|uniref:Histidine biosynthesis bifunctional protein HisIE n=1 Tax=Rufibacter sediminis TaxID=2762756 RepID=A0ABR6VR98_9BACT|nr:bifunctional phosphoribosyl-AMP cyclohydrolase/phosphoribosyl-ATP diphosphatase HisIE [Rufibacter sediminis]MBC3539731.1 bifunctional phosphoribosyl-AMP cyclohydrolase/phosphoribosyl-ATP diphosphatase HisIE [Rufibacter sediminis]